MFFVSPNIQDVLCSFSAILMIGEPTKWESCLQLLIDLLVTEGKPTSAPSSFKTVKQLPIIACNMDLVFMAEACMPRFGHGAFLVCLEALYKVSLLHSTCIHSSCTIHIYNSLLVTLNYSEILNLHLKVFCLCPLARFFTSIQISRSLERKNLILKWIENSNSDFCSLGLFCRGCCPAEGPRNNIFSVRHNTLLLLLE